ncbi:MAG TPA: hypothetical protein VMF57_20580 [Solirubrobacteraceae bacterium]|nr:hypothetical protein [Solirubrobacteraceae bacterium]
MSGFTVDTQALANAAQMIAGSGQLAGSARSAAASVAGQEGAFGNEPIAAAFAEMCGRAQTATGEIETTVETLSRNVGAAALGYLVTNRGVVAMYRLPGFKP